MSCDLPLKHYVISSGCVAILLCMYCVSTDGFVLQSWLDTHVRHPPKFALSNCPKFVSTFVFCMSSKNILLSLSAKITHQSNLRTLILWLLLVYLTSFCREDLRTFILGQVTSRHEGGHKLRFSLYLSSQLMFGIIRVYQRQAAYLLGKEFPQTYLIFAPEILLKIQF